MHYIKYIQNWAWAHLHPKLNLKCHLNFLSLWFSHLRSFVRWFTATIFKSFSRHCFLFYFFCRKFVFISIRFFYYASASKPSIVLHDFFPPRTHQTSYLHIISVFFFHPIKLIRAHFKDIRFKMTASVLFVSRVC